jgi:transglutaminase-like putative cysteine protease
MSRTTLCFVTAAALAVFSIAAMTVRHQVLGREIRAPMGPGVYKVTMLVRAKSQGNAKIRMLCPLDFKQQHVFREEFESKEMAVKPVEGGARERRPVQWIQKTGGGKGPVEGRYEFYCAVNAEATAPMSRLARQLYEAPRADDYQHKETHIDPNDPEIVRTALRQAEKLTRSADQAQALFQYVSEWVANEPAVGMQVTSDIECLQAGRGDAAAKSRLLAALCRSRGIPARLVSGLKLTQQHDVTAHWWVEAWTGDKWLPMCPSYGHFGKVPANYLVIGFGDEQIVRGHNVRDLDYSFLVEHHTPRDGTVHAGTWLQQLFRAISLDSPPPGERALVEFLLLLPVAALIICICRNVIGLSCFGTFAPALIGLAFRQWESLPGILVFVSIVLIGWGFRRILDSYHLLQVPRTSFLLSLVVVLLLGTILAANYEEMGFTLYFSLFPMVILTGMIERFWTLETEDSTTSSFRTLMMTMGISALISLTASWRPLLWQLMHYPETLGLVMAGQLLIGRYTGYRLLELFRFRDFAEPHVPELEGT